MQNTKKAIIHNRLVKMKLSSMDACIWNANKLAVTPCINLEESYN